MRPSNSYIQNKVLEYFRALPPQIMSLPFDIVASVQYHRDCAIMTYQEFALQYNPLSRN
jgi:hypothetical protein